MFAWWIYKTLYYSKTSKCKHILGFELEINTFQKFTRLVLSPQTSIWHEFFGGSSSIPKLSEKVYIVVVILKLRHTIVAWRENSEIWSYFTI